MSDTTELLVFHDTIEPPEVLARLASSFEDLRPLKKMDWDGVQPVWGTALARVSLDDVIARVGRVPWRYPENVQVMIKRDQDQRFQLWTYTGPSLTRVVHGNPDGDS